MIETPPAFTRAIDSPFGYPDNQPPTNFLFQDIDTTMDSCQSLIGARFYSSPKPATIAGVFLLVAASLLVPPGSANAAEKVHVYNWNDYIADDTIENFQRSSGIEVSYDVYDSNDVLEAKLLPGHSGYDLVFPTARPTAERHIAAGLYQPLDKSRLSNYHNLDPQILQSLLDVDPGNRYLVPYMWGTTGIGINVAKVQAILGDDQPLDSWNLLFDPKIAAKLASCGIAMIDDPIDVFGSVWAFLGKDTADVSTAAMEEATAVVAKVRPYVRYFHSSQYINDLANGDICIAQGYSGDILQARDRAEEADNGVTIVYLVPTEGAVMWTDVMAIPVDAPNPSAALTFINFLLLPEVIAGITDYVAYANANSASTPLVDEAIRLDPGIYPPPATRHKLFAMPTPSERQLREMNRLWTRIKTGM